MPRPPADWHAQDWILVAHALARTRWQEDLDDERAYQLLQGLALEQGLPPAELLCQDDL